jgi:NTE family protein
MSMSIPLFFKPVRWTQSSGEVSLLGDPGLLAALPIWLFDVPGSPRWPTFGLRMVRASSRRPRREIRSPMSLLKAMYFTALETHDTHFVGSHDFARTIAIDALDVGAIDFRVNLDQKDALFASGVAAAEAFLESWDFETYKLHYRGRARAASDEVPPRVDAVLARPARLLQSVGIADSLVQSDTGRTTLPQDDPELERGLLLPADTI